MLSGTQYLSVMKIGLAKMKNLLAWWHFDVLSSAFIKGGYQFFLKYVVVFLRNYIVTSFAFKRRFRNDSSETWVMKLRFIFEI